MIKNFNELKTKALEKQKSRCAVIEAADLSTLKALEEAVKEEIVEPYLFGNEAEILSVAEKNSIDLTGMKIVNSKNPLKDGIYFTRTEGDYVMKGHLATSRFLKGVLDKEFGLRTTRRLSHVAILSIPAYKKLLFITDGGMNIKPDLKTKTDIIKNAILLSHKLDNPIPKVGILSAVEVINPDMEDTIHAAELVNMSKRHEFPSSIIDGPLAMDLILSKESANIKNVVSEVAGETDIMLVPDITTGNAVAKALIYLANSKAAGIIAGAKKPVVMLSRADNPETKFNSILLGAALS